MKLSNQGKSPEETGRGGEFEPVAEGKYHCVVKDVDDTHRKHEKSIPVEFEVLAGTCPGQEGKKTTEFFYHDPANPADWAIEKLWRLAWACGLIGPGEEKDVDMNGCIGRHLIVEFFHRKYTGRDGSEKKSANISSKNGGMWPIGHPDVNDVATNREALGLAGDKSQVVSANTSSASGGYDDDLAGL